MSEYLSGNYYSLVNKGKIRENNEDYAACSINAFGNILLAVADGMGGANKGEYASKKIVTSIINAFQENNKEFTTSKAIIKWLNKVIKTANTVVYNKSIKDEAYKNMGTTLSLVFIAKNIMVTAQVGDSRIYMLKDNKLEQISTDQTYVQYLTKVKKLTLEEALTHPDRHKLTNALGTKKTSNVDFQEYQYNKEKILICSDGLYNNVPLKDIESIVKGNDSVDIKRNGN